MWLQLRPFFSHLEERDYYTKIGNYTYRGSFYAYVLEKQKINGTNNIIASIKYYYIDHINIKETLQDTLYSRKKEEFICSINVRNPKKNCSAIFKGEYVTGIYNNKNTCFTIYLNNLIWVRNVLDEIFYFKIPKNIDYINMSKYLHDLDKGVKESLTKLNTVNSDREFQMDNVNNSLLQYLVVKSELLFSFNKTRNIFYNFLGKEYV